MRPPLRRSREDRVIAGVCGGIARTLGIDPIIVRVIVAAFTIAGGAGLFAYALAWLLIPDDTGATVVSSHREGSRLGKLILAIVLAALTLAAVANLTPFNGQGAFGVFLLVLVGVVVWQAFGQDWFRGTRETHTTEWAGSTVTVDKGPDGKTVTIETPAGTAFVHDAPRSPIGRVVWNLLLIVIGVAIAMHWAGSTISYPIVLAVMLAIVGLGLVVSAFAGRARGLIALGLLLTALAAPPVWRGHTDVGNRTWIPVATAPAGAYSLGVGDATLDLRTLDGSMPSSGSASVGIGTLRVLIPSQSNAEYVLTTHVALGQLRTPDTADRSGSDVSRQLVLGATDTPGAPVIRYDLSVSIGTLEVRYA